MNLNIYQVDAFSSKLFAGNPAAVIPLTAPLDEPLMQSIAAENNLAETAFVVESGDGFQIRWFTPTVEVDLCGHATLAAAHVYFNHLGHTDDSISFSSKSGPLHANKREGRLYLDFPADKLEAVESPEIVAEALSASPVKVFRGRDDFLAVFENEQVIVDFAPKFLLIEQLPVRGLIVTAPGNTVDFVSRFFAPQSGILEDPVTGSAHASLTPYWAEKLGKTSLSARQISPRSGDLLCKLSGDRVEIGGSAVTYLIGEVSI